MFLDLHSGDVYRGTTAADVYNSVMPWTLIYNEYFKERYINLWSQQLAHNLSIREPSFL